MTATITQAALTRCARAIFALLSQLDPTLTCTGGIRILPSSVGSRNYLCKATLTRGQCLLKLRSDPAADSTDVSGEGDALSQLPAGLGPALWSHVRLAALRERAAQARDLKALKALELPLGDGLLMSWIPGETPEGPFGVDALHLVGRALAQLHLCPLPEDEETLPRHNFPRRPSSMLRVCDDLFEELQEHQLLQRDAEDALAAALDALHQSESLQRLAPRPPQLALCHGDLRWHNLHVDQGRWRLLDWEDAGIGDPAVDLALMASRTPLTWWEELCILEAYTADPMPRAIVDRFFVLRPLVSLLCAMSGLLDLVDVCDGVRPITEAPGDFLARRWPAAEEELEDAIQGVLGVWQQLPPIKAQQPTPEQNTGCRALIAIDGPSVSFKSPFAQGLADALGLPYYNKGALFRYVALWAYCHERSPDNPADRRAVIAHIKRATLTLQPNGAVGVGGDQISEALLLEVVEQDVAAWAAQPQLRAALQPIFAALVTAPGVIEGRDVGTELAPHADIKLYTTAALDARVTALAQRSGVSKKRAKALLKARDKADTERTHAPLRCAEDAITLELHPDTLAQDIGHWSRKLRREYPLVETP